MAKKRRKKRNKGIVALKVLLCAFLLTIVGGFAVFFFGGYFSKCVTMKQEADELVSSSTVESFVPNQTGEVYASDGAVISEIQSEKDASYIEYEDIPEIFVKTMVSIEDKKFYSHNGVDYKAILRAFKELAQKRRVTQGGSTITMQLARGIFLTNEVSWQRKVKEIFISWNLEEKYSKDQIMEFYLNNIYFANGYYGIQAAANGYFNKDPKDLDVSQVAFLCAIPNSPTYYDPIANGSNTLVRRDLILYNMLNDGVISQASYDEAVAETIVLDLSGNKDDLQAKNNYTVTYAYHCATEALMQLQGFALRYDFASDKDREAYESSYNEVYSECESQLHTGGYKIYTSFDMDKQEALQQSLDEGLAGFTEVDEDGGYKMQGAAVCIDNTSGMVVAMVGGRSEETNNSLTLNRAYQSRRQPGSSIKPLVVYTPAFEKGYFPKTEVEDKKIENGPKNAGGSYHGEMPLSEAVQRSLNTVAWQVYEDITPQYGLQHLKDMHFSKIVDADVTLATALGGFTYGVEPVEMAAGFATIVNDGMYREPTCIIRIENYKGDTIYTSNQSGAQVYKKNAARMMVHVLEGVLEEGWGTGRSLQLAHGMPAAGKTGTTDEAKDGWFCGFTHYYTTSVWVGCDTPEAVRNLQGATYPGQIWKSFMNTIHEGLEPVQFEDYDHTEEKLADGLYDHDDEDEEEEKSEESTTLITNPIIIQEDITPTVDTTPDAPTPSDNSNTSNTGNKPSEEKPVDDTPGQNPSTPSQDDNTPTDPPVDPGTTDPGGNGGSGDNGGETPGENTTPGE